MSVLSKLASSIGRRDEVPNQELAREIASRNDKAAIKELVAQFGNASKANQSDAIKVLYEIGELKPALIADYLKNFVALLNDKNPRLVWGAMTALSAIALENPILMLKELPSIIRATEKSESVIARDQLVKILTKLCTLKKRSAKIFPLLLEQVNFSPINQLPSYAEHALSVVRDAERLALAKVVTSRLATIDIESKRKRLEKVLKKLGR